MPCVTPCCRGNSAHNHPCLVCLPDIGLIGGGVGILRWAGHVTRMPMTRIPRKFLSGWVANPGPLSRSYMTWGHTLKRALKAFNIPTDFEEWAALAKNRNEWKHRTRLQENDPHAT